MNSTNRKAWKIGTTGLGLCFLVGLGVSPGAAQLDVPAPALLDIAVEEAEFDAGSLKRERGVAPVAPQVLKEGVVKEWCQTQLAWEAKAQGGVAGPACGVGACDTPAVRDSWIPGGSTPIRNMRIHFNVFCNTDGTSCAGTQAGVDAQVVQLNNDFAPSKIQFCYTTEFINNTTYRQFADAEEAAMKNTYADSPGTQLNVYVVNIQAGYLGVGTFPWDPDALGNLGGLIIDDNWFGAGQKTLTHEVGHCVGLWHTHHGVSEVSACSACYERADGVNGDTTGDFAGDTAPTPTNFNCAPPGGTDSCSGVSWGATDPQNYMGYAPDSCYTEFSPHQFGRMHCWSDDVLLAWSCGPITPTGGCCVSQSCSIETEADCGTAGGTYLGDGTDCAGTPGTSYTYSASPNVAIPDGGGPGNPATHTINVPDSFTIGDVNVRNTITHTWVGDLIVTLQHGATTVTIVDRPGYSGTGFGCSADNYTNIALDDEGTAAIESQCVNNLTSPPNYTPNQGLSAFDGQNSSGAWTIRVSDNATSDVGTLNSWSVVISEVGEGPCDTGCVTDPECSDGLFCNGAEVCNAGTCQAGTPPNCADAVACTTDTCNETTDSCDHTPNNGACSDGLFCNGSEVCNVTLGCQAGTPPNCADAVACTTDSCNESTDSCDHTPNNAACSNGLFCDGSEVCNVTTGCQDGPDPCTGGQTCDEGTDTCIGGGRNIWMSFTAATTVPGLGSVANEDIVAYNTGSGTWSWVFDGSDVGLGSLIIDGVARLATGDILLSFTVSASIPGMTGGPSGTTLDDSDIVRFVPTSLGSTTAGSFVFYFDGSDVGLDLDGEDIDAISLTSGGSLVVSTTSTFGGTGASGQDEDLFIFNATSLGSVTSGSFVMYFDGSDVGLSTTADEDVDAAGLTPAGKILLSTLGLFSVTGVSGDDEDVIEFTPTSTGTTTAGSYVMFLDLSALGIATTADVSAVEEVP